jgi:hypothetical protein
MIEELNCLWLESDEYLKRASTNWVCRWNTLRLRPYLGFLLGLLGISLYTLGYVLLDYSWEIFHSASTLGVMALWFAYFLFGPRIQRLSPRSRLSLGLILLAFLPLYMWSYDSTYYGKADLISVSRTIYQDKTVSLTFSYDVYSTLDPLPLIISDTTFYLHNLNFDPQVLAIGSCKGGALYPFGHMRCNPTFMIALPSAHNFTGNIIGLDFWGGGDTFATSLMYSQSITHRFGYSPVCWNMVTNTPATFSVSGSSFVCS